MYMYYSKPCPSLVGQKRRTFTAAEKDLECQGWVIMASFGSHHEVCPVSIYHTVETGGEGGGGKYGRKSPKPSTIMQVRNDWFRYILHFFSRRNPSNVQ
jgi:hypothetical protein